MNVGLRLVTQIKGGLWSGILAARAAVGALGARAALGALGALLALAPLAGVSSAHAQ